MRILICKRDGSLFVQIFLGKIIQKGCFASKKYTKKAGFIVDLFVDLY